MRPRLLAAVALCTFVVFSGCSNETTASNRPAVSTKPDAPDPREQPPHIGMTKAQVIAQYGEPKAKSITDKGENWAYVLNFGEMMGKALIPFHPITQPRIGSVIFGTDGKVKEFN